MTSSIAASSGRTCALGGPRAPGPGRSAAVVLPGHEGTALPGPRGQALRPDAGVGPGRQDQRVGPRQPAPVGDGLQGGSGGRLGDPVAHLLRRHLAVLRQGRGDDRRLRRGRRLRDAARQQVPAAGAGAALRRAAAAEGREVAGHRRRRRPPRQHDQADPRLSALPLLRRVRRRLRHGVVLLLRRSPDPVRAQDRQARDPAERGRRARPGRRQGQGARCPVLRSQDRGRARGAGQGRDRRRQLRRLDAHPAQLEVDRVSERHRQQLGRDRPLPVRADPPQSRRLDAGAGRRPDAQRSRHRRRARLPAALQPQGAAQARLPARLRRPVLEHRLQRHRRAQRQRDDPRLRRRR